GRNAVRGLRPPSDSTNNLENVFSRLPQEVAPLHEADFRFIAEGSSRALHPIIRGEVYRIGREALTNAFRHSNATSVQVEVSYGDRELRVSVRDDGRGIEQKMLRSGREGHCGIQDMRERAEAIGARLKLRSREGAGTEVELAIPGHIAYELQSFQTRGRWFKRFYGRKTEHDGRK